MVEGPGNKLKGEKMRAKIIGQIDKSVSGCYIYKLKTIRIIYLSLRFVLVNTIDTY